VLSVTLGLIVSFHYDTAAGASAAGMAVGAFFVASLARAGRDLARRRRSVATSAAT
jgi:ABC-type Mn2+/Zn2+ transport system permease subunit